MKEYNKNKSKVNEEKTFHHVLCCRGEKFRFYALVQHVHAFHVTLLNYQRNSLEDEEINSTVMFISLTSTGYGKGLRNAGFKIFCRLSFDEISDCFFPLLCYESERNF